MNNFDKTSLTSGNSVEYHEKYNSYFRGTIMRKGAFSRTFLSLLLLFWIQSTGAEESRADDDMIDPNLSVRSASICAYAYTVLGDKTAGRSALANAARLLSDPKMGPEDKIISKEDFLELQKNLQKSFKRVSMTKRESAFYLLSSESCLLHSMMGAMLLISEQEKQN